MSDKLSKRVEESRQSAEAGINKTISAAHATKTQQTAWMTLGGIGVVNYLAKGLNSQTIHGLQRIRDEKLFEAFGYNRFDDFLDEFEHSPMSYRQFNDREKMLLQEGDDVFDLLNNLKISHRQRRMLGAGNVQIDEASGTVIITAPVGNGDIEATKTEEIELTDRPRLLQTLSAIADQAALLNAKNNKQKERIERGEKQVEELQRKLDDAKKRPGETKIFDLFMIVSNTLQMWANMVKNADAAEKAHGEFYLDPVRRGVEDVAAAYRKTVGEMDENEIKSHVAKRMKNYKGDDDFDVTAQLSNEELAELIED